MKYDEQDIASTLLPFDWYSILLQATTTRM